MNKTTFKRWFKVTHLARMCHEGSVAQRDVFSQQPDMFPDWAETAASWQRLSAAYARDARKLVGVE